MFGKKETTIDTERDRLSRYTIAEYCSLSPSYKRDYDDVQYFVDADGNLWKGPVCPHDNIHYGRVTWAYYGQCVTVSNSNPMMDWVQVSPLFAARMIRRMRDEWIARRKHMFKESLR